MTPQVRSGIAFVALAALAALTNSRLQAQTTYPFIAELKQNYGIIKDNHLRMADKMPEEHYGFKPAPEIRSFGEAVAHTADLLARSCNLVSGQPSQPSQPSTGDAAPKRPKAELIAALKASFAICDAVLDSMTDASASDMVKLGQSTRTRSKLGLLIGMTSHANEQYGYMAVYLRLKGIVPPSSETQR